MIETICFLRTWKRVRSFYATQSSFQSDFLQRRKDCRGADYVSQGGRSCNSPARHRAIQNIYTQCSAALSGAAVFS